VRPVSSQVVVGALTVHTVAVEGDVRRTVYWPGVGPDDGAAACMTNIIAGFRAPGAHRGLRTVACPHASPSRARNPASRRPRMATA